MVKQNKSAQTVPNNWELTGSPRKLITQLACKNFMDAVALLNKLAELAEEEGHHPDICLHDWNKLSISLYTHSKQAVTDQDYALANKINELL